MDASLIRTKLQPPQGSQIPVERLNLIDQLNQRADRKLTLVSAPAGYGKSTLVAEWLGQQERPFAWLSLDSADNHISRFLSYLIAAVRTQFPEAFGDVLQLLQSPELPPMDTLLPVLINEMLACPQPFIIVLDDWHVIHDEEIQDLMNGLLDGLPRNVHLLLVTRADPLLPLARLRAGGEMVEVRGQALRFSDEEAYLFFEANMQGDVDRQAAKQLNERVEGWAVGLQMEALSMRMPGQNSAWPAPEAIPSNAFVSDYLFSEVLQQQMPAVQEFLLRTSLVDRFSVDLCQIVLDGEEGSGVDEEAVGRIIDELSQANLFIIPLDEKGKWFRYHHLFQQMLQQRVFKQRPQTVVKEIYRRASVWFGEQGFIDEALAYALASGDMETAVAIVEANTRDVLNGLDRRTQERWMDSLPEGVVWQRPKLLTAKAWLLYRQWRLRTLETVVDRIVECLEPLETNENPAEREYLLAQVYTLRSATSFYLHLDYAGAIASADLAVQMLPATELGSQMTARLYGALAHVGLGRKDIGVRQIEAILHDPAPLGRATLQAMAAINLVHYLSSDYVQMDSTIRQFLVLADNKPRLMAAANWVAGLLRFEQNQLEAAFDHYSVIRQMRFMSNYVAGFYSELALIRMQQILGKFDLAQAGLDDLRADVLRIGNRTFLKTVEAMQAYQWRLEGDLASACRWANSFQGGASGSDLYAFDPPLLIWARILITCGSSSDWEKVEAVLQKHLAELAETGFARRKTQLLAHLASVSARLEKRDSAIQYLKAAVILASPAGAVRSFVDVGDSLVPLLMALRKEGKDPGYVSELLEAFAAESAGRAREVGVTAAANPVLLTRREEEILQLMRASYSNQEIAERLVIALSTVKRHASNIYIKLDVNSRRQAVRRAEQLGILARQA